MYRRVFAFGFDGTLAENGVVPPNLQAALIELRAAGSVLFLVTGRRLDAAKLGSLKGLFTGIVWENGAVLYHTATHEIYLPFGQIDLRLAGALEAAGVPLEYGRALVTTYAPLDRTVWNVLSEQGGSAVVAYNKGAVLIAPPGAAKGAGLERMLMLCGLSPRSLVCFGDGENDLSLLQLGELGIAVSDAVPILKDVADIVTAQPGPAGVFEALEAYWPIGPTRDAPLPRRERPIPLGEDRGSEVHLSGAHLAGGNLGVFGDSGSGKSWVIGLLAEGMQRAGYQTLLIDPEGDFRGMRALPGVVALEGEPGVLPSPAIAVTILEKFSGSVVVDLCAYPIDQREAYIADLLCALQRLKQVRFRPHWVVLEEAQYFLPPTGGAVSEALMPMLPDGGWAFVSYRPDRLYGPVLAGLDHALLTRLTEPEALRLAHDWFNLGDASPPDIPPGHAWLCGQGLVRLRPGARRVPHIRHLYKYLDAPLPPHKRFYFRDEQERLDIEAASLHEFIRCLTDLPMPSLVYHYVRDDFAAWAQDALGDAALAAQLRKLTHRALEGERLREAIRQCLSRHYAELSALR